MSKYTTNLPPEKIFFTSDHHFLHEKILEFQPNRLHSSLEQMTEDLIERWNSAVSPTDVVFHLGDFALTWGKKHEEPVDKLLKRLNGQKFLIRGNHDRDPVHKNPRWCKVEFYHEIKVDMGDEHAQRVVMCHYPIISWNQRHRGAYMLHGHSHGNLPHTGGNIMDVGVDCNNFTPVDLVEVRRFMQQQEQATAGDHHQ